MAEEPRPGRVCNWSEYMTPIPNCFDSLFLGLFLSTLDTSIVATALVTIVIELNGFQQSPWVVVIYLLLYMSRSSFSF
jgi:MFS family permease